MPCPSVSFPSQTAETIIDLLELHTFTAGTLYQPNDKGELVAVVLAATSGNRSVKAIGSKYSLSAAFVADDIIDTSTLCMHLSQPFPPDMARLGPGRIRGVGSSFLHQACTGRPEATGRRFVHVEAGVKVRELLADLSRCGLALPTMGAGGGQSLAGSLSTGTHGADFQVSPLVEWIQALHLVGSGGQEWWITPSVSLFSDQRLLSALDWCADTYVVADNDVFNAVRVSVGRIGVIYSMILEVVDAYSLLEVNFEADWPGTRERLVHTGDSGNRLEGLFEAPFSGLKEGWFHSEILSRTVLEQDSYRYKGGAFAYNNVTVGDEALRKAGDHFFQQAVDFYDDELTTLGLTDLAVELGDSPKVALRHLNIAISLSDPRQCWITRRWRLPTPVSSVGLGPPSTRSNIVQAVIDNKKNPMGMIGPLVDAIGPQSLLGSVMIFVGNNFLGIDKAGRYSDFLEYDIPRIAAQSAAANATSGETLFMTLYKLATDPILAPEGEEAVLRAVSDALSAAFSPMLRAGLATEILDTHDYGLDGALSGNSAEFFFDGSLRHYLDFIDVIVDLSRQNKPVLGYIGIRFTPASTALIAMQRFPLTVSVEVATQRSRLQDVYASFWRDLHIAAIQNKGIPHWGQEFKQSASEMDTYYGTGLELWRTVLAELSTEASTLFSTAFSRAKGLEPLGSGIDPVQMFLTGLEGGTDFDAAS